MKKKGITIAVVLLSVLFLIFAGMFLTDYCRSLNLKTPMFAKAKSLADDGGSGTYRGLFYRITVEKHTDAESGVITDAVTMMVGDQVVAASVANTGGKEVSVEDREKEDWGLTLSAQAVTADGMTLIFTQSGGTPKGELMTGEWFALEQKVGDRWESVKPLPAEGEYAFNSIGYGIPSEGSFELPVLWNWMYGSLPKGEYRISKRVMDFVETGIYTEQIYYAEFAVE